MDSPVQEDSGIAVVVKVQQTCTMMQHFRIIYLDSFKLYLLAVLNAIFSLAFVPANLFSVGFLPRNWVNHMHNEALVAAVPAVVTFHMLILPVVDTMGKL